jgi:isopentenyldiphosphate isomerase
MEPPLSQLSLSAMEIVEIVDENNSILTPCPRHEMRAKRLIHRATYAFVRNSDNYFYVQKRSDLKDYCAGYFDPTPGGVVGAGESYEDTNARELEEEMGIPSEAAVMTHVCTFFYEDSRVRCFGDCWDVVYDGPVRLQPEEVAAVHLMSMAEIMDRHRAGELFTPDSIHACEEYVRLLGMPPPRTDEPRTIDYY